ncbi:MAG: NAD-dependent epimerase/dehydratase [Candidatus Eremiobacterota bacterium]
MWADALLLGGGLTLALLSHALAVGRGAPLTGLLGGWLLSVAVLVPAGLAWLTAAGLYTPGRSHRNLTWVLRIAQGVGLGYLTAGVVTMGWLPAPVLLIGWLFTTALLAVDRLGPHAWASSPARRGSVRARRIQNVLVIGGAGYIGSALLPKLLERGYRVRLLDLLLYGPEPVAGVLQHPNLQAIQADFRQVDRVVEAMQGIDAVIHLGGIVGDPACALDEELTLEVNLMATRMIAEVAKGSGVSRFLFASTCSVYGACDELLSERSTLNPISLYARSKIASERVLLSMLEETFHPTCLRFGTIYGLSGRTRFDLVVNLLTAKAVFEGEITVHGGAQWRPFLHVDDAALAILLTVEAPADRVAGEIFNVGSNEQNRTIEEVAHLVQTRVPEARLIHRGSTDARNYRVAFDKIRQTLGFVPRWTLEQGVAQVLEAIRRGDVVDYRESRYSNAAFLTQSRIPRTTGWAHELIRQDPDRP